MNRGQAKAGVEAIQRVSGDWPEPAIYDGLRAAAAIVLAGILVVVDGFTTLADAFTPAYCLVILVAGEGRSRSAVRWSVGGSIVLASATFVKNHGLFFDAARDLRFACSIVAVLTAGFLVRRQGDLRRIRRIQSSVLDTMADAIILSSCTGEALMWNRGAEDLYGWSRDEMIGKVHHHVLRSHFTISSPGDLIHGPELGRWVGEVEQCRKDGRLVTVSSRWRLMLTQSGAPWAILESSTDITALRAAEQRARRRERRYQAISETLAVPILEYDFTAIEAEVKRARASGVMDIADYYQSNSAALAALRCAICVTDANEAAVRLFGEVSQESLVERFRHYLPCSDEDFVRCLVALDRREQTFEAMVQATTAIGDPSSLIVTMAIPSVGEELDCVLVRITELTEKEFMADEMIRMRGELDQAMRTAMIGEISAIISHEVNQPIAAAKAYMGAARRWLGHQPANIIEATEALNEAIEAARRAGQVVKTVRRLFNVGTPEALPIGIDAVISECVRFAARELGGNAVRFRIELRADGAMVSANRTLLQQSLLTLMFNSLQAMNASPQDRRQLSVLSEIKDRSVRITVEDTGPGFPPELVKDAADAFSGTGRGGFGIGLAVCRSSILSMGGAIEFANRKGGAGAIVSLIFAVVD